MTVYVDDFRVRARVGGTVGRWSHLTADTPDELHEFADRLGHRREWFQARCRSRSCPVRGGVCRHFHYDVVDTRRSRAISLGARTVTLREMGALVSARRARFEED